jgi:hypothetical protein
MDVIVALPAAGYVNMHGGIQPMPIVEWLSARILIWRRLPGGVAISHVPGSAHSRAACDMAELMMAAGIGVVVCGIECLAAAGPVAIPLESGPFVFVGAPGVELGQSLGGNAPLVAAVLVDARLTEIPLGSFANSDCLRLVALPSECAVTCAFSFYYCGALVGTDLGNVEVLEDWSFQGCYSLSHIGAHSRLRSMGFDAFQGVAVACCELGTLEMVAETAFEGSGLREFSGYVGIWGPRPFENCRDLQRLEIWPG